MALVPQSEFVAEQRFAWGAKKIRARISNKISITPSQSLPGAYSKLRSVCANGPSGARRFT
jgi:hypothetical protein